MTLPSTLKVIFVSLSNTFTTPTASRVAILLAGAILARGRHTITSALRAMGNLAGGHFSSYHRVFSRASFSMYRLGQALAHLVMELVPADQEIVVVVDETTAGHRGPKVYGIACYRDDVYSTRSHTTYKWGHKWVVLGIVVKFPFARCRWCLPIMAVLYRPPKLNKKQGRRHKTQPTLARQMLACLIHWFPGRKFILVGDGTYTSQDLGRFCAGHGQTLVSLLPMNAALFDPPPKNTRGKGRRRVVGIRRLSPREEASGSAAAWQEATVEWYGGTTRRMRLLSQAALWYTKGHKPVPIRWVYVVDPEGRHKDYCLFSTDQEMLPDRIVELYTRRWSLEVTFEEVRAHLGFETTRQRTEKSILRTAPCLLGLFTVVSLAFSKLAQRRKIKPAQWDWYEKKYITFSDALSVVRRQLWEIILSTSGKRNHSTKIPPKLRNYLLDTLSLAA